MKRLFPILFALLFAGGAYAQEEIPMQQQPSSPEAKMHEGVPLPSGARELAERGNYEVQKSLEQVRKDYKAQLESAGYTVNPMTESENSAIWEVSKGEKRATVTIQKLEPESVMLSIQSRGEGQ